MLFEFALDPGILSNFHSVRYFLEKFGVHRGRLIARFPRKWKKMVYEACAACRDVERKKIEESLINADVKFVSSSRDYDGNLSWLNNAEDQHTLKPFRAIITDSNPRAIDAVLIADELTEVTPLWNVPREIVVPRRATDLARHMRPLLQISSEILFVDPHFNPNERRYQETLKHFVQAIGKNDEVLRIEYHLSAEYERAPSTDFFQRACRLQITCLLPVGMRIKFKRWRQIEGGETLHPRYILTDKGGVRVEHGLDEGEDGETTDISILDLPVYQQRWRDYHESPAFELVDEITIVGSS
ncbi:MAG TPA: hypothetical protein DCP92_09945 [Nitrospiraceae bacterium]|jgi:hypothetical protein|nr:hypothetical protein [Nitrospiraceae bacterium]